MSRSMGAGLVAGAAVGLLWLAAKRYGRDRAGEIIDWDQVSSIARRTSQALPWAVPREGEPLAHGHARRRGGGPGGPLGRDGCAPRVPRAAGPGTVRHQSTGGPVERSRHAVLRRAEHPRRAGPARPAPERVPPLA